MVETVLSKRRGNQSETARELGITPRSVYNKLRKYGMTA
jgi:DNA-binding NtrC family response regulator